MNTRLGIPAGILLAMAMGNAQLQAQGSSVYAQSACMTARAGAGVAAPCADGSAIFYNPAALATQQSTLGLGVAGIRSGGSFIHDGTGTEVKRDVAVTPVPHGWANFRATDRLAVGVGVWAPYGLGIEWPESFEGRFVGYDNSLRALYIQPTVAYQLIPDVLSLGVGFDYVRSSVNITQRLDLANQATPIPGRTFGDLGIPRGTDFAEAILEGDGTGTGWHVGMQMQTRRFDVGMRYLHGVKASFDDAVAHFHPIATGLVLPAGNPFGLPAGTPVDALVASAFEPQKPLCHQALSTEMTFPSQFVAGLRVRLSPQLALLGDYQWTEWKSFDEFPLAFEYAPRSTLILDYRNTSTVRLAVDYAATDALQLRGGFIRNTAATPDETVTPLLPEAERTYLAAGLGYRFADRLTADMGYQYIHQDDRRGRVQPRPTREFGAEDLNVGVYTSTGHILGLTLSYEFGPKRR
jgi:long-chain fatty acid transport protein